ncbi:MAG: hypothetical protein ACFB15_11080 [Cyclobacteriaceae bacterium]
MSDTFGEKPIEVVADLTLSSSNGDVRVSNDHEGDLIICFPNQKSFFSLLNARWPMRPGWNTLVQLNRSFYKNRQAIIIRVQDQPWLTLGRFPRPRINYRKVAAPYLTNTTSLKNIMYLLAAGVGATLLYFLFRKRN